MDVDLSADQVALRTAATELLEDLASFERVRAFVGADPSTEPPALDEELWEAMTRQGWLAVEEPEDRGGLGAGMVEVAVLCEQVGRHAAPAPFLSTVLAAGSLRKAAADPNLPPAQREASASCAARLAAGEAIGCVAWAPDGGRPEPAAYAPVADVDLVVLDDEVRLLAPPAGAPRREPAMDRTRPLGWLEAGPAAGVSIGERVGGARAAARLTDRIATAVSAEMLGAADRVLAMSVAYAKDRVQFGRPIGSFQAIKHRLADALVDVEGMRSTVHYAAWCIAAGQRDASLAASTAKAWCSEASRRVMATALQVHGGIGFTWEHGLHVFLKRAQLDQVSYGDAAWHRDRIAAILRARLAAGEPVP